MGAEHLPSFPKAPLAEATCAHNRLAEDVGGDYSVGWKQLPGGEQKSLFLNGLSISLPQAASASCVPSLSLCFCVSPSPSFCLSLLPTPVSFSLFLLLPTCCEVRIPRTAARGKTQHSSDCVTYSSLALSLTPPFLTTPPLTPSITKVPLKGFPGQSSSFLLGPPHD